MFRKKEQKKAAQKKVGYFKLEMKRADDGVDVSMEGKDMEVMSVVGHLINSIIEILRDHEFKQRSVKQMKALSALPGLLAKSNLTKKK